MPSSNCCSRATHWARKLFVKGSLLSKMVKVCMCVWEGAVCAILLFRSASFLSGQAAAWKRKHSLLHHSDTHRHTFSEKFSSGGYRWNAVSYGVSCNNRNLHAQSLEMLRNNVCMGHIEMFRAWWFNFYCVILCYYTENIDFGDWGKCSNLGRHL